MTYLNTLTDEHGTTYGCRNHGELGAELRQPTVLQPLPVRSNRLPWSAYRQCQPNISDLHVIHYCIMDFKETRRPAPMLSRSLPLRVIETAETSGRDEAIRACLLSVSSTPFMASGHGQTLTLKPKPYDLDKANDPFGFRAPPTATLDILCSNI